MIAMPRAAYVTQGASRVRLATTSGERFDCLAATSGELNNKPIRQRRAGGSVDCSERPRPVQAPKRPMNQPPGGIHAYGEPSRASGGRHSSIESSYTGRIASRPLRGHLGGAASHNSGMDP